jgi:hypothetical protein
MLVTLAKFRLYILAAYAFAAAFALAVGAYLKLTDQW